MIVLGDRDMSKMDTLIALGGRDVPQLVKMIGPDPAKFNGLSQRLI